MLIEIKSNKKIMNLIIQRENFLNNERRQFVYQFVGFLKMAAHGVVLGLAEEGLDVTVVGLQDAVEVLQRVLT